MADAQFKGESLAQQLSGRKRERQEIVDNKNELLALRGENNLLKRSIE